MPIKDRILKSKAAQSVGSAASGTEGEPPANPNTEAGSQPQAAPKVKPKPKVKIPFAIGTTHGHLLLLRRVRAPKGVNANLKRQWRCKCECGEELTVPEYYMKRKPNPKTHCGCMDKTIKTEYNREYRIWLMMHERCFNETHVAYKNYGGRGIQVCMEWRRTKYGGPYGDDETPAFEKFLKEIGPRPSRLYSVDRIDNYKGYEPGNVRWSTDQEQAANKRKT